MLWCSWWWRRRKYEGWRLVWGIFRGFNYIWNLNFFPKFFLLFFDGNAQLNCTGLNSYSIHSLLCFTWMSSVGLIPYGPCCLTRVMAIDILLFKGSESGIYLNLLNCFDYSLSMMWLVKNTLSKFFHFYLICNLFDEEKRISRRSEVLWRQLLPIIIPDICWRK